MTLRKAPVLTKEQAGYREAEPGSRSHCGNCDMFVAGGRCTLVKGEIDPADVCNHWALTLKKPPAVLPSPKGEPWAKHSHCRVIVLNADGQLLLMQRADRPTQWEPISGTIGHGDKEDPDVPDDESAWQAAHRELEEETGYAGPSLRWAPIAPRTWVVFLPEDAPDPKISVEHLAYRWTTPEEADVWLARERFYASIERSERLNKQGEDDISARILEAADLGDWDSLAKLLAGPISEGAAEGVVGSAQDAPLGPDQFNVAHDLAQDWAAQHAAELVRGIADTTEVGLRRIVEQALEEGWSPGDLQDAVLRASDFSPARAKMIARTELALAHSNGTMAGWRASGQVAGKRWLLSNDHARDDDCDINAGVGTVPLETDFPSGDSAPPAHPNCECVVVPVLVGEDVEKLRKKYQSVADLPADQTRHMTDHEKHIFLAAWNSAYDEYGGHEDTAFAVAHAAVNRHRGVTKYSEDQPRVPPGQPGGGEWTSGGQAGIPSRLSSAGDASGASSTDATSPPGRQPSPGNQSSETAKPSSSTTRPTTPENSARGAASTLGERDPVTGRTLWQPVNDVMRQQKVPLAIREEAMRRTNGIFDRAWEQFQTRMAKRAPYRPDRPRRPSGTWASERPATGPPGAAFPLRWEHRDFGLVASALIPVPGYAHGSVTVSVRVARAANSLWTARAQAERYPVAPVVRSGFLSLPAAQDGASLCVEELRQRIYADRLTRWGRRG